MPAGTLINQPHYRIRHDVVDNRGHVTLRFLGKLRHLNVGWKYQGQRIRLYCVHDHEDIVTEDGEVEASTQQFCNHASAADKHWTLGQSRSKLTKHKTRAKSWRNKTTGANACAH